jgi:hypothetical protein
MAYEFNFAADAVLKNKAYPALAKWPAQPYTTEWRQFRYHWPYTVPCELHEHCATHLFPYHIHTVKNCAGSENFYTIGLGFFDFDIDYFSLIPNQVFERKLTIVFYYHEGDDPAEIKQQLDVLCGKHRLHTNCYVFVSGNTAAKQLENFVYFTDFELWYCQRNRASRPLKIHREPREFEFTVLNRLHKSWRALAMADLQHNGILDQSYWSYCESGKFVDAECAIEIDAISGLRTRTEKFLKSAPYISDELDFDQRNNHSTLIPKYHVNSYCNIVMETHFDISGGAFLTEKTFKPIKHGQMFFIAGPAGSLQVLRDLGYRVFDSVLDNSYDLEPNATQRWMALTRSIFFTRPDLPQLFELCRADIEHNQQLFQTSKTDRLNTLIKDINESH